MGLKPALCTQCGQKLEVDPKSEAAICEYCGTPFITEKAINNYNTTYVTNIDKLHADVVNVSDNRSIDNRVKSADAFLKFNDTLSAESIFAELTRKYPYDYRGWWGLIRINSKEFTDLDISRSTLEEIDVWYNKAYTVASNEERQIIEKKYEEYYSKVTEKRNQFIKSANEEIDRLNKKIENENVHLSQRIKELEEMKKHPKSAPLAVVFSVLSFIVGIVGILVFPIAVWIEKDFWDFLGALLVFGVPGGFIGMILNEIAESIDHRRAKDVDTELSCWREEFYKSSRNDRERIEELQDELNRLNY